MFSTHHHNDSIDSDNKTNKPEIINYHNQNKGGVDAIDQLLGNDSVRSKTNRWMVNVFYFMIDAAVQNAFASKILKIENSGTQIIDRNILKEKMMEDNFITS